MKKLLAILFMLAVISALFSVTAFAAAKTVDYYDENGNAVVVNGLYYNSQGLPMYNASCYYLDADGNAAYVGGCRAYYYNADGELTAGSYYYGQDGKAVSRPTSYPGGYGCGMWYYNAQGSVVEQETYYDDFGNVVDPPAVTLPEDVRRPAYRGGCCGGRGGWR